MDEAKQSNAGRAKVGKQIAKEGLSYEHIIGQTISPHTIQPKVHHDDQGLSMDILLLDIARLWRSRQSRQFGFAQPQAAP